MSAAGIAAAEVTVNGKPIPPDLARNLNSVRVATRLGAPAQCELAYSTLRGNAAEQDRIPLGAAITVRMTGDAAPLFAGEVTCITLAHAPDTEATIRVRCYDLLHRLRKRQRLRVFTDLTAVELAEKLTADLGLSVLADEAGPVFERIVQHRQNDFALLASTAARAGLYPVAHGGELRLVTLLGYGPPVDLELGVSLLQAEVEANLDQACSELTALGWDSRTAEPFEQRAGEPRSGRQIPLRPEPGDVGVDGTLFLVDQRGRSADELAALAQAAIDVRAQGAVTLTGVAEGDAQLRAGRRIAVRGMAERVAGTYVLTEAIHTVDATGYLTALSTEPDRDGIDRDSRDDTSITLGVVTDVDDPERLGRVRISLLAHGEAEVGWLGVMCPGAGKDKGFLALPDTGDTVLVALPHGPVGGVVLGSLYGGIEPPDPGVHDGAVRRWSLRTADGQALVADDAAHRLTLANQAGTVLDLAPGVVTLHCATDLMIQAPGRAITVRAKSVDFVHAPEPEDAPAALATDGGR